MNRFSFTGFPTCVFVSAMVFAVGYANFAMCGELSATALDRYVAQPDPEYAYSLVRTIEGKGFSGHVISMTSQSWLTEREVDRTVWKHWLTVITPDEIDHETGLIFVNGGDNDKPAPKKVDGRLSDIAVATRSVVAELRMVPNQPLTFVLDETEPRREDGLIAYGWDRYLRGGDETWLPRLPMTKSVVRAMDTVSSVCSDDAENKTVISKFVVAGASKRGWTTWTTAAVDDRVVAIVPMVIDLLNMVPSFKHHWEAYGFWAPAVDDYVEKGIMDWLGHPRNNELLSVVEPYQYRERYTMPKLMINSTGDEFFVPDSSQFYFDDLPGTKFLRYVPNTSHSLGGSDAHETLMAFYAAVLSDTPFPKFSWKRMPDGSVRVTTKDEPSEVRLWQTTNPDTRDFRKKTIGKTWTSSMLENSSPGVYVADVPAPAEGWTAFMVELTFRSGMAVPFKFTTDVYVVPATMPFTYTPPATWPDGTRSTERKSGDSTPIY